MYFQVLLLLGLAVVCLSQEEVYNGAHLCAKVMSGDYSRLHLQSIYSFASKYIVLLESGRKYYVELAYIKPTSVRISDRNNNGFLSWESRDFVQARHQIDPADQGSISSIYTFSANDKKWYEGSGYSVKMLLTGQVSQYWLDLGDHEVKTLWKEPSSKYNFSIITDGQYQGGYVISPDFGTKHHDFAMYDLTFMSSNHKKPLIWDERMPPNIRQQMAFYYFEAGEDPNQVVLVSGMSRDPDQEVDKRHRLFNQLPVGFIHQSVTYLFDNVFGCVYIIPQLNQPLTQYITQNGANEPVILQRVNIPFEQFFECDRVYKNKVKLPKDRCNHTNQNNSPRGSFAGYETGWSVWHWIILAIGLVLLTTLAVVVVVTAKYLKTGRKKTSKRDRRNTKDSKRSRHSKHSKRRSRSKKERKSVRKTTTGTAKQTTDKSSSARTKTKTSRSLNKKTLLSPYLSQTKHTKLSSKRSPLSKRSKTKQSKSKSRAKQKNKSFLAQNRQQLK